MSAVCGTYGGYQRHRRRGQAPCGPCRQANAAYHRDRRVQKPKAYEQELAGGRARSRALWRLADEYPQRFRELVAEESKEHVTT